MKKTFLKGTLLGLGLALGAAQYAAAADTTINLTTGGTLSGSGNTTVLTYNLGGGHTLAITAWYDSTSNPTANLVRTQLAQFSPGLGVCDPDDGSCGTAPEHEVDNHGDKTDWVLFAFDSVVNLKNVVIDPVGSTHDTDASYFTNTLFNASNYTNAANFYTASSGVGSLGTTETTSTDVSSPHVIRTVTINANGVTYLLFGAKEGEDDDFFKIKSITFDPGVVPEPVTWMMMILGFAGLAMARRRSQVRA